MAGRNKNRSTQNPQSTPAQQTEQKLPSFIPSSDEKALAILQAAISPVSFWPPDYYPPHSAWLEHAPFAFWLIETLRPRFLVELGTHQGSSYFAFCQAVQRLQLDTCCYAVDTWKGDEHTGFYGEEVFRDVRNHNDQRYSAFSTLIRSTFDEASHHFRKQSIDLLHIDGRHFYDDVKHDFETWQPKLSNRAVVIFHNTNVRERDFSVFALWRELCQERPHFEFFHGHGIGILGIGNDLPDGILALFAAQANVEASTQIRRAYSRLGSAVTFEVRSEQVQLAAESQVAGLNKALAERDAKIVALDQVLADRTIALAKRIAALKTAIAEQDSQIAFLQSTVRALRLSTSWRITAPLRVAKRLLRRAPLAMYGVAERGDPGNAMTLDSTADRIRDSHALDVIARSGLFDSDWYLEQYPEVRASGVDAAGALRHFIDCGASEGRDPNPFFSTKFYDESNPDVAETGLNPVVHYLQIGAARDADPSTRFHTRGYLRANPDVAASELNPLQHFLSGLRQDRHPKGWITIAPPQPVGNAQLTCWKQPATSGEVALFVTHSPDGHLKPHVPHYLNALRRHGIKPTLIIAADHPVAVARQELSALVDGLYVRQNLGFDFAAWAHVLREAPELFAANILYLLNDSVIGPLNEKKFTKVLHKTPSLERSHRRPHR